MTGACRTIASSDVGWVGWLVSGDRFPSSDAEVGIFVHLQVVLRSGVRGVGNLGKLCRTHRSMSPGLGRTVHDAGDGSR